MKRHLADLPATAPGYSGRGSYAEREAIGLAGQKLIRHVNERRVLTLLRQARLLSRAEIARRLGVTRSTVTSVVDELIARGMAREIADPAPAKMGRIGRPGTGVALDPTGSFYAGVEIGVGVLRAALVDLSLATVRTESVRIPVDWPVERVVARIGKLVATFAGDEHFAGRIRALGLTVPGIVAADGTVVHLPILGWRSVNLLAAARRLVAWPLSLENNANAAAFGEVYADPGAPSDVVLYLKIGTGCGGAAILQGRLLRGAGGSATEFGHIRVADDGDVCSCGQHGCLEMFVNVAAMRKGLPVSARQSADIDIPGLLAEAVAADDQRARTVIADMRRKLARGLVELTNVFSPSRIVLGGIARPVLAMLVDNLRRDLAAGIVPGIRPPTIALSRLGDFECAIGAALVMHHQDTDVSDLQFVSLMAGSPGAKTVMT